MSKIVLCKMILAIAMFVVVMPAAATVPAAEVYMMPQQSNATFGEEVEVEIWINATGFKSGQVNLTYDSGCANVTNFVWNAANFPMSGWTHYEGSEWITFVTMQESLAGNYQIGTLTIQCVSDTNCGNRLVFVESGEKPCKLGDPGGSEISADWVGGTFDCKIGEEGPSPSPTPADEDTHEGSRSGSGGSTHARAEDKDTNLSSEGGNETEAPAVNETPGETPAAQEPDTSPAVAEPTTTPTPVTQTPSSGTKVSSGPVIVVLAAIVFAAVILRIRRYRR